MKQLLFSLSSLSLVAAACGGVVQRGGGGTAGADDSSGSGSGSGGGSPAGMNAGPGMPVPGKAGAATTPPGAGGKASAFGGASGVGGGAAAGGAPSFENVAACKAYCFAYSKICPELGFGDPTACILECTDDLELSSDLCANGKAVAYECIATAMYQNPGDCGAALTYTSEVCGSATPDVPACHETCLPSVSGDSTRCHATAQCGGSNVDLSCYETGSNVACNCSVDGKVLWKSATNLDFAKSACLDADLFRLCAKQLQ